MPYKLSATLAAHSQDVRSVASPAPDLVLSASRDSTAICWARDGPAAFQPATVLRAGSRFVNAVAYVNPTQDAPKGYAVTGGQDTVINLFDLAHPKDDPDFTLIGHTDNVCALHVGPEGTIISGSWDKTAKVWKNFSLAYDLKGHDASVWAVLAVGPDQFLTGSADKTIKLWAQHKPVRTFSRHTDAVRGLVQVPDIGFASCSNDSEIHVWTMEGDLVYSLSGHTSFVYSLALLPSGDLVSAGEDRSVRVWKDGECAQTIVHPAISVWTVSTMPNGDIVSGCSDGIVRVFSADEARWAAADQLKEYDEQVASQQLPAQQVANMENVLGPEALLQPGKKPGQVIMVKNERGGVEAHQWDASAGWQKIGDVVDAVGSGRKQLYQGREYDYVFDVDIKDGEPPLKLPYNANENAFSAAQRFLEANELPMSYIDQVADFITRNSAAATMGAGAGQYVDPYTGASRYQSSAASVPTAGSGAGAYVDPYTGASRYVSPGASAAPSPAPSTFSDPYTGASRYSGAAAAAPAPVSAPAPDPVLPVRSGFSFQHASINAMRAKMMEFDQAYKQEISALSYTLSPGEIRQIDAVLAYLNDATGAGTSAGPVTAQHLEAIASVLGKLPTSGRFPVMDMCRLVSAYCPETLASDAVRLAFLEALFKAADWTDAWTAESLRGRKINLLLLFRSLSNMFHSETDSTQAWIPKVLDILAQTQYAAMEKVQRVSYASLLFNISTSFLQRATPPDSRSRLASMIHPVLENEKEDSEAAYRGMVAYGNLAFAAKTAGAPLDPTANRACFVALTALPGVFPEQKRIKNLAQEIGRLQ